MFLTGIYVIMVNMFILDKPDTLFTNKSIWKLKLSLKIKIFLWYLQRGVILTKDNLAKIRETGLVAKGIVSVIAMKQ